MLVIRAAAARLGTPRLVGCDLYVTLEPCPMCATAASFARLRRIYYGAEDPKGGGVDHGPAHLRQPDLPPPARGLWRDRRDAGFSAAARVLRARR